MKRSTKFFAFLMACLMLVTACLTACNAPEDKPTEQTPTNPPENADTYNIIFALATIPPVLAALDAIDNGYETYAIIERGKTYNGIQYTDESGAVVERIEGFHNAGFDPNNNLSTGFTKTEFDAMVAKVKELNDKKGDAFFNFYLQDGTALLGAAIAANAGLTTEQFHVYMCEDGTGAYTALNNVYVKNKTVNADKDEVYETYQAKAESAKAEFEAVMAKNDNKHTDSPFHYNIGKAYALASLPNFTYYIQDEATVISILESTGDTKTKLLSAFGAEGYNANVNCKLNLKYQKISAAVDKLTAEEKENYLTLMYGQYFEDTYAALTRTERADETAPAQKLVYIGTRHSDYPKLASGAAYGIGGLAAGSTLPATYAELDSKYKTPLLFENEADYLAFLDVLADEENYTEALDAAAKEKVKVACFNLYIDYIFNLKLTYLLYGADYDIIMKGHPREVIGEYTQWGNRYKVEYGTEDNKSTYCYDKLLDNALLAFHKNDSVGKFIGMVPYGTAAENLAYLGANISLTGLPSSTYQGYDTSVDVLSIFELSNQDIAGTGSATADSQVAERYGKGDLIYTDKDGNKQTTKFYNLGNMYKAIIELYTENGDATSAATYEALFASWLAANHPGATDIDAQGFPVIPSAE